MDSYEFADPKDIIPELKKEFWDGLASAKWSERKVGQWILCLCFVNLGANRLFLFCSMAALLVRAEVCVRYLFACVPTCAVAVFDRLR